MQHINILVCSERFECLNVVSSRKWAYYLCKKVAVFSSSRKFVYVTAVSIVLKLWLKPWKFSRKINWLTLVRNENTRTSVYHWLLNVFVFPVVSRPCETSNIWYHQVRHLPFTQETHIQQVQMVGQNSLLISPVSVALSGDLLLECGSTLVVNSNYHKQHRCWFYKL